MACVELTKNDKDLLSSFASGFKDFIKRKGYDPKELSKILGVSESSINGWRYGRNFPDVPNLFKLVELGLSFHEVLNDDMKSVLDLNNNEFEIFTKQNVLNSLKVRTIDDSRYADYLISSIEEMEEENIGIKARVKEIYERFKG